MHREEKSRLKEIKVQLCEEKLEQAQENQGSYVQLCLFILLHVINVSLGRASQTNLGKAICI